MRNDELLTEAVAFDTDFRTRHPVVWLATLAGPPVLTALAAAAVYAFAGAALLRQLLATAAATFFFFGKFVILGGMEPGITEAQRFFTRDQLSLLVVWMDLATASLLVFHSSFIYRIPFLGSTLAALADDGRLILQNHAWIRRATFLATVLFVAFPLAATGSVGASIFGRLLGMSRLSVFVGISLGSLLGCAIMYSGAGILNRYINRDDPLVFLSGIAFVAAIILLLNWRYRRMRKRSKPLRKETQADARPGGGQPSRD